MMIIDLMSVVGDTTSYVERQLRTTKSVIFPGDYNFVGVQAMKAVQTAVCFKYVLLLARFTI
jgi:hypothetical protein